MKNTFRLRIAGAMVASVLVTMLCALRVSAVNTKLPILMYHNLSTESSDVNSMTITVDRFRQDMEFLHQYGFTPLLSADLINIRAGTKIMPANPVMITFDDGYESNYTYAFPILKETEMKATISLITSHIRNAAGDQGIPTSLTWDQIKEMYDSGIVDIGSHSHALHNEENDGMFIDYQPNGIQRLSGEGYSNYMARIGKDLIASLHDIRENLGPDAPIYYFSYPFGATDDWFGQALIDNRFFVSTTTKPMVANIASGLYGLPRYRITMDLPISKLLQHTAKATPAISNVTVDGEAKTFPSYQIEGKNYVKLRDIAALLNATEKKISVNWLDGNIILQTNQPYVPDGSELNGLNPEISTGTSMLGQVMIDNQSMMLAAYEIKGNYYFNLRNLCEALNIQVAFDEIQQIVILETK